MTPSKTPDTILLFDTADLEKEFPLNSKKKTHFCQGKKDGLEKLCNECDNLRKKCFICKRIILKDENKSNWSNSRNLIDGIIQIGQGSQEILLTFCSEVCYGVYNERERILKATLKERQRLKAELEESCKRLKKELDYTFWANIDYDNCLIIEMKVFDIIDKEKKRLGI